MYKYDVIIPVFNVEKYLTQCLSSLLNQPIFDFRLIVVNDGSTDNSYKIAEKYKEEFGEKILLLTKKNGGLSDARNYGLKFSTSKYVIFIDSDDWVEDNFFEVIEQEIKDCDILVYGWKNINSKGNSTLVSGYISNENKFTVLPSAWSKVYKRSMFDKIEFPEGIIFEDIATTYRLLARTNKVNFINNHIYNYRITRKDSILNSLTREKIEDIYKSLQIVYNDLHDEGFLENYQIKQGIEYQFVKLLLWSNFYQLVSLNKINHIRLKKDLNKSFEFLNKKFPDWDKNELVLKDLGSFFEERFGKNHVKNLRRCHKSFFSIAYIVLFNIKKRITS